jgi:hypothetical protein
MNSPALKVVEPSPAPVIRRFDTADLTRHGAWILPRMMKAFPHMSERSVAGFLQTINYNNEYLLLYYEHGVALAQIMSAHSLDAKPIVYERFVWVENPEDKEQVRNAAEFYTEFYRWAKSQSAEVIIVEENTDVPHELIKEKLGRIFTRQQQFARV